MIPLCSYARVERLQGVALTSSPPSTGWTACLTAASLVRRRSRPAVLLACWTLVAKPKDLLSASQPDLFRKVPMKCIACMTPVRQNRVLAFCKGWVLQPHLSFVATSASWAASFMLSADSGENACTPLVTTGIIVPGSKLMALCHHSIRGTIILLIVPLSCHRGVLGSQGVVLAHFACAALRTTTAICPTAHFGRPAVQVPIWALITYPSNLFVTVGFDADFAQMRICSMVPLLL